MESSSLSETNALLPPKAVTNSIVKEEINNIIFIPDDQLVWVVASVESMSSAEDGKHLYDVDIIDPEYAKMLKDHAPNESGSFTKKQVSLKGEYLLASTM
jgi:hypothetical protein